MRSGLVLITLAVLATYSPATAAISCPDRTPAAITSVATASLKCQETIAKEGAKFLKSKIKALAKCKLANAAGVCPMAIDTFKIETAANKAAQSIAAKCAVDSEQAGLTSSYGGLTDDAVISSCMLSQHNVVAERVSAESHGVTTEVWPNTGKERADCMKTVSKAAGVFFDKARKNAAKCIATQMKLGTLGNLSPICVGAIAGGTLAPPSDAKAQLAQSKLVTKIDGLLSSKCQAAEGLGHIATMFACAGSETVADLQLCLRCTSLNAAFDVLEQEYAESGTFVAHAAGAIQAAVTAATPGQKLLIASGDYQEEVLVSTDGLQLVGCGGATNDRPRLLPPGTEVFGRGIRAADVDGLGFQSLKVFGYQNDGIFVSGANGVSFRDIVGDGNLVSRYAVFPVQSNNVLVELSKVDKVADAGIYVGQSSTIIVRHNQITNSVAGVEIENSGNAQVYDNYSTLNTGGLLVFKDGSLPVQLSQCHEVHHNLLENNNTPNFGSGTVSLVPTGTGMLVISNDTTPIDYNIVRGNDTFGIGLVDQLAAEFGPPYSADESLDQNHVFGNIITGNGTNPDTARSPVAADLAFVAFVQSGNCHGTLPPGGITDNINGTAPVVVVGGTPPGPCTLPEPAFPACPAPPISSTTTSTTTTSSSTSTSTTTTSTSSTTTTT